MNAQDRKRFWDKVRKTEGCWIWEGTYSHGRPVFYYADKQKPAQHIAFESKSGFVHKGEWIHQHCGNKKCVNPAHLTRIVKKDVYERRFWTKVKKTPSCWLWTGAITNVGYGLFYIGRKLVTTHRFAYTISIGPVPQNKCVLHHCDVRHCVNPAHLFIGTRKDNTIDAQRKGRLAAGERSGVHCLTATQVRKIRRLYARGKMTQRKIAAFFSVTQTCVSLIIRRKRWKHVK